MEVVRVNAHRALICFEENFWHLNHQTRVPPDFCPCKSMPTEHRHSIARTV